MQRSVCANGAPTVQTSGVVASDGAVLFPEEMAQTLGYDGAGNVITITVVAPAMPGTGYAGGTYVQTLTWVGANCTNISGWVKQ